MRYAKQICFFYFGYKQGSQGKVRGAYIKYVSTPRPKDNDVCMLKEEKSVVALGFFHPLMTLLRFD